MEKPSPYVGPRAYRKGEGLHGRAREARELVQLLAAERIVVLYSPSGAGKTSLIQAGLDAELARLPGGGFHVLPLARVSGKEGPVVSATPVNPYVASVITYWEEGRPEGVHALADLDGVSLNGYLTQRSWIRSDDRPVLVIIDQFEEILTRNPRDLREKQEFFRQLGLALQDRGRWALLAMREEHIAGLDPYLELLPTRLGTRYRLELLTQEQAREAVARPAEASDVHFDPEALQRLVDELTLVHEADGPAYHTTYVEPLHLQVACDRLWKGLPAGTRRVPADMIDTGGTVADALAVYYRDAVQAVAKYPAAVASGCGERRIRDWIEDELIGPGGLRDQVHQGANSTEGLPNSVVKALEDHYLLRSELRRGTLWYEIAHDRLVDAVRQDNQAWYETQSEPLRLLRSRVAEALRHGPTDAAREHRALLTGDALTVVETWARENPQALTESDRALIAASQEQRQKERERARLRVALRWAVLATIVVAVVSALYLWRANVDLESTNRELESTNIALQESKDAFQQQAEVLRRSKDALTVKNQELEQKSQQLLETATQVRVHKLLSDGAQARWRLDDHGLAALLTLQSERFARDLPPSPGLDARIENSLRGIVQLRPFALSPVLPAAAGQAAKYGRVAFSPDGKLVAVQVEDSEVAVFSLESRREDCPRPRLQLSGVLRQLDFTGSGHDLVTVTDHGLEVFPRRLMGCANGARQPLGPPSRAVTAKPPTGPFCTTADETLLFVAVAGGGVERWPMSDGVLGGSGVSIANGGFLDGGEGVATAMACDPAGRWVAVGDDKGRIALTSTRADDRESGWDATNDVDGWPKEVQAELGWARDWLDLGVTALIPWVDRHSLIAVFRHGPVAMLPVTTDGRQSASLTYLRLTRDSEAELRVQAALGRASRDLVRKPKVLRAAFDPAAQRLVVGGERSVGVWSLGHLYGDQDGEQELAAGEVAASALYGRYEELRGPPAGVAALSILDGGDAIITTDAELNIRLWLLDGLGQIGYAATDTDRGTAAPHAGVLYSLAFTGEGQSLAVGASRHLSRLRVDPERLALAPDPAVPCTSGSFRAMARSPDGRWLALVTRAHREAKGCQIPTDTPRNAVWIVDTSVAGPTTQAIEERLDIGRTGGWAVAWGTEPPLLAAGDYDGNLWLWRRDAATGLPNQAGGRHPSRQYASPIRALAFHPTRPWLAVGTEDGTLDISRVALDAEGGITQVALKNPDWLKQGAVRAVAFSPDGATLAFGNDDGLVGVMATQDLAAGAWKTSHTVFAHSAGVAALDFCGSAPTGTGAGCVPGLLASAGNDGRVRLWRVKQSGEAPRLTPLKSFEGPAAEAVSVTFSPDGRHVLAGDARGVLHLWRIEAGPVIEATCAALRRNLSWEEWIDYVGEQSAYECTCPNLPPGADVPAAILEKAVHCGSPRVATP